MKFDTTQEFFENVGDCYLRPDVYGVDCAITVEEMYQHFKNRMLQERNDKLLLAYRKTQAVFN